MAEGVWHAVSTIRDAINAKYLHIVMVTEGNYVYLVDGIDANSEESALPFDNVEPDYIDKR